MCYSTSGYTILAGTRDSTLEGTLEKQNKNERVLGEAVYTWTGGCEKDTGTQSSAKKHEEAVKDIEDLINKEKHMPVEMRKTILRISICDNSLDPAEQQFRFSQLSRMRVSETLLYPNTTTPKHRWTVFDQSLTIDRFVELKDIDQLKSGSDYKSISQYFHIECRKDTLSKTVTGAAS